MEDAADRIEVTTRTCIPNLYVSTTRLRDQRGNSYHFHGLYSSKSLSKGDFIGLYNGNWHSSEVQLSAAENNYAVDTGEYVISPPLQGARPNPQTYPISMANEPMERKAPNSTIVTWQIDGKDVIGGKKGWSYPSLGLVACRNIPAHSEITWFYGQRYGRDYPRPRYKDGKYCKATKIFQNPVSILGKIERDGVGIDIRAVESSDSDGSDEEWKPPEKKQRTTKVEGKVKKKLAKDVLGFYKQPAGRPPTGKAWNKITGEFE